MRSVLCIFIVILFVTIAVRVSYSVMNPHIKPDACESCHSKIPTDNDRGGEYFLLKDSIDDTCHICHEKTCCKPGSLHGISHPSNIDRWDWKLFRRPKTLPLQTGFITCNTCHLHTRPDGPSYKMLRIVRIDGKKIDWTELCNDCHVGY